MSPTNVALALSAAYFILFMGCVTSANGGLLSKLVFKVVPIIIGTLCLWCLFHI